MIEIKDMCMFQPIQLGREPNLKLCLFVPRLPTSEWADKKYPVSRVKLNSNLT
jgi:hypothetical protein